MYCQGIERKKEKIKTEIIINQNDEYTTPSPSLLPLCQFQDINEKKYFYLKTASITNKVCDLTMRIAL